MKAAIVSLPAEIDLSNEPAAAADLLAAIDAGPAVLLVDMTGTTFIDSAGARMLYVTQRDGARRGTDVRFAISHRSVLRTLELMGYDQALAIHPSCAAALEAGPVSTT